MAAVTYGATKFCKDCKWFVSPRMEATDDLCTCPQLARQDPVRGASIPVYCKIQRAMDAPGYCGPKGEFWQERLT